MDFSYKVFYIERPIVCVRLNTCAKELSVKSSSDSWVTLKVLIAAVAGRSSHSAFKFGMSMD